MILGLTSWKSWKAKLWQNLLDAQFLCDSCPRVCSAYWTHLIWQLSHFLLEDAKVGRVFEELPSTSNLEHRKQEETKCQPRLWNTEFLEDDLAFTINQAHPKKSLRTHNLRMWDVVYLDWEVASFNPELEHLSIYPYWNIPVGGCKQSSLWASECVAECKKQLIRISSPILSH